MPERKDPQNPDDRGREQPRAGGSRTYDKDGKLVAADGGRGEEKRAPKKGRAAEGGS